MNDEKGFRGPVDGLLELKNVENFFAKPVESGVLQLIAVAFVFDVEADRRTPDALDHRVQILLTPEQATQLMKVLGAVLFEVETSGQDAVEP